jgi:hypothetical protein
MKTTTRPIFKSKLTRLSLAAFLALPMAANATTPTMIDDFSAGYADGWDGTGSFSESISGVLGGVRKIDFSFTGKFNGLIIDDGLLSSATNKNIGVYTLTYEGGNADLNLDLSTASSITVRASADFWSVTTPSNTSLSQLSVALTDFTGLSKTLIKQSPTIPAYDFGDILFNLNDLAFSDLNKTHISRISVSYTSAISADTNFDSITIQNAAVAMPVPEGDSALLMLMGFGLVNFMVRRRA